jgi:serine/threonine protein kinase
MEPEKNWLIQEKIGEGGQGTVHRCLPIRLSQLQQDLIEGIHGVAHSPGVLVDKSVPAREKVWKAYRNLAEFDKPENQFVIKRLKPRESNHHFESANRRTINEITIMKQMAHPNLIRLIEHDPDFQWYVSPFYSVGPLDKHLHLFAGNVLGALKFFRPIVDAVAALHREKIVHRDLKPHNVFLASEDRPIVGDFGLTYYMGADSDRLTLTEESVGTKYWRPEWAAGIRLEDVKPTFDVFSLGKIFWALVSGEKFLNLWYWNQDRFNVERMYPDAGWISIAKEVFRHTIVEHEKDCLPDADSLLEVVDGLIAKTSQGNEPLLSKPARICLACGSGSYQIEASGSEAAITNFGFSPRGSRRFNILACNHCGHTQIFTVQGGQDPEIWKAFKAIRPK